MSRVCFAVVASSAALIASAQSSWQQAAPMPFPRSEVAATPFRGGIAIVGGFSAGCRSVRNVDLYLPATNRWRRLPALPSALNHATAASAGGRLYVAGGYGNPPNFFRRDAFVLDGARWRRLPRMPGARGAAGSAIVGGKWYILGGRTTGGLARQALVFDLSTRVWSTMPGPTPREHLAVTAANGKLYVLGGRLGGADSNLDVFEVGDPSTGTWKRLPPVPEARGGTGLAAAGSVLVSVGGETLDRTIGAVYGYDLGSNEWKRLPDLTSARHGLAVAAVGRRVYAIAGSPVPGCGTAATNEYLDVGP